MKWAFIIAIAGMPVFGASHASAQAPAAFANCLDQEDGTKERLNCYDKLMRPEIQQVLVPQSPKSISDCRFLREEDQRLACFNRFVMTPAKPAAAKRVPRVQ